ncbi:MAG: DUF2278 family protein [Stigonema ocellatum SAG 48.90 = DSM 106950]|nr:DUF2278 family protein [Stigonema ocellatum SAG 48.90 = DSM 106950]
MSNLTNALLVGLPTKAKLFSKNPKSRPHYHILVEAENQQFDIAVNIASEDPKTADVRVLYAIKRNITPPQVDVLLSLKNGMFELPDHGVTGIDFVRDHLVAKDEMKPLPLFNRSQPIEEQGSEEIKNLIDEVVADPNAVLYAFGHRYDQSSGKNPAWGFEPDDGIHNIHMNQGNYTGNHDKENGRGEDGALFLHFPSTNTWHAVYIAFQTQSFDNDSNGYPKDDSKQGSRNNVSQGHGHHHHHGSH